VSVVVPLLLSFGAVLGAVSLAGDAASGSLRAVLVRPVSRPAVVLSRAAVLALGLTAVYAASILVALLVATAIARFDSVTLGTGDLASELIPRGDLLRVAPRLVALALPALVCSALVGLMVSSWWNDPSSSAICALLLVLSPYLVEVLSVESSPWLFTHGAAFGSSVLSELAGGVARRLAIASSWRDLWLPFSMPLLAGAAAVAAGCITFSMRDFRG
jgi:ABC-2 type transport system permease protein